MESRYSMLHYRSFFYVLRLPVDDWAAVPGQDIYWVIRDWGTLAVRRAIVQTTSAALKFLS